MKKITLKKKTLLASVFALFFANIYGQKVYISEVLYDSPLYEADFSGHNGEYVELYNPANVPINVSGWSLTGFFPTEVYKFPTGTFIQPQTHLLIVYRSTSQFNIASLFPELMNSASLPCVIYHDKIRLSNKGETITLKDLQNNVIDEVAYYGSGGGNSTPQVAAGEKQLYARNGEKDPQIGFTCLSLHRNNVTRGTSGNAVFRIDDWQYGLVTPLGEMPRLSGFDHAQMPEFDINNLPADTYDDITEYVGEPTIDPLSTLTPTTGDILYNYDNGGNRIERVIYFSSPRDTRIA